MPARAKSIVDNATVRPRRVAKDNMRKVIATTIAVKPPRNLKPRKVPPPVSSPSPAPPSPAQFTASADGGDSTDLETSRETSLADERIPHNDLMDGIETIIRDTMLSMFVQRNKKENKKAAKVATTATVRVPVAKRASETGINSPLLPMILSQPLPIAAPRNILSRWSWVDRDTIGLISSGQFDIDGLPKLHRKDELRNVYLKKTLKGIYQPLAGGPSEVIIGTTRLQSSFRESTTFFLAWQIYVSIRSTFHPERGPGLADWTERLFYFIHLNYSWYSILDYVIAYYQKYQNSSSEDWFDPDPTLIAYHLTLSQQRPSTAPSVSHTVSKPKFNTFQKPTSDELCVGFNRETGCHWKEKRGEDCPRRHICSICFKGDHNSFFCPTKKFGK
jgi:hypothetical protein